MILVFTLVGILLWAMSSVAWEEGRPVMAWIYFILSAANGALVLDAIF